MRILAYLFVVFISCILLSACYEDPDCINLRNDILGITFKKVSTGEDETVEIISIILSGSDSVFNASKAAAKVYLPLNVNGTTQTIDFNFSKGSFMMVVEYKSQAQFESVDCGPRFVLTDLKVKEHTFDSLKVTSNVPFASASGTNIVVYSN